MVYGSSFVDEEGIAKACGCPLLPLKSHIKGPALVSVQEHLLHKCGFRKARGCRTLAEGTKAIINLSLEQVSVPGESGFPLPWLFTLPQSQKSADLFRNYLRPIRGRPLSVAYRHNKTPNNGG